jgi:hypothetical protein
MNNYGIPGLSLDMLKMAPVLPKTPEEAILLSNLYQVQSTVAKLAAQQEIGLDKDLIIKSPLRVFLVILVPFSTYPMTNQVFRNYSLNMCLTDCMYSFFK